ncbi:MAG: RNA polymerase sigma factor RpoD/SigA [Candidatus Pacebacteria bacterium]|nr:RNA polymerase sigma factor RpoD/SigA [Candidatus Paceibacterota bacterium]
MNENHAAAPPLMEQRVVGFGIKSLEMPEPDHPKKTNGVLKHANHTGLNGNGKRLKFNGTKASLHSQHTPDEEPVVDGLFEFDLLKLYMKDIGQFKLITPKEEIELAKLVMNGDNAAREKMINANLRLVVKIAKTYQGLGLAFLDLVNIGNIGLVKGVERFRPGKGSKLSTYASLWIKQSIRRALGNQSRGIRLPIHMYDKIARMRTAAAELEEELGREPTDEEIAAELGIDLGKVEKMKRTMGIQPARLDSPVGEGDSGTLADFIPDEQAIDPLEDLCAKFDAKNVHSHLSRLSERESAVLRLRFGIDNKGECLTLDEIGNRFEVTRERVRQIEAIALHKMRASVEGKPYRGPGHKKYIKR